MVDDVARGLHFMTRIQSVVRAAIVWARTYSPCYTDCECERCALALEVRALMLASGAAK